MRYDSLLLILLLRVGGPVAFNPVIRISQAVSTFMNVRFEVPRSWLSLFWWKLRAVNNMHLR